MLAEIIGTDGIILIVVVAVVLLIGGARLPKIARNLGSARSEFEKGVKESSSSASTTVDDPQA